MTHQGESTGTSLQVTSQTEGSLPGGMGPMMGLQGKSIMGLYSIYCGIFSRGDEGGERESLRWFGKEEVWKIEGKGGKRGWSHVNS